MDISENDIILLGHGTDHADIHILSAALSDSRHRIRSLALSALIRRDLDNALIPLQKLATDEDWHVRRRTAELSIDLGVEAVSSLLPLLDDEVALVRETACFAIGEIYENAGDIFSSSDPHTDMDVDIDVEMYNDAINKLIANSHHDDPLVRESAVASLGNIGDERARTVVIEACSDKAPIRRRAVVALAAFTGDDVDAALDNALLDHDWQVRQAAEDISGKKSPKE